MVRTPAFLADRIMAAGHSTTVVERSGLGASLTRLVLACDDFRTATTEPGDSTAFRTGRSEFRHYTPAVIDRDAGHLTIITYRHGSGPGEALIEGWTGGEAVQLCKWASVRSFRWHDGENQVVVIGDATVISWAMSAQVRAAEESRPLLVVLEVPVGDVAATRALVPGAEVVRAEDVPGAALDSWLERHSGRIRSDATVFLAGHGQSIQRQRAYLRDSVGMDRRQIRTQPFWADGKTGL